MRCTPEELDAERDKIIAENDAKLKAFRQSVHEFAVIEANNRGMLPPEMAWALVEEAGLAAGVVATMSAHPAEATAAYVAEFLGVLGWSSKNPKLSKIGEQIGEILENCDAVKNYR